MKKDRSTQSRWQIVADAIEKLLCENAYDDAAALAFQAALEASKQYDRSHAPTNLVNRAIFYSLAAAAAQHSDDSDNFVMMYFMSFYTMDFLRHNHTFDENADSVREALENMRARLQKLRAKIAAAGINPDSDARTIMIDFMDRDKHWRDFCGK